MNDDTISRRAAIDAMGIEPCAFSEYENGLHDKWEDDVEALMKLPSAQPEMNMDELCTDCKEYDHKRHCCPRWNRVIRQTLKDAQPEPQWIPVSERLPDMPIRVLVQLNNGWIITAYRQDNEWLSVPDFGEAIKDKWVEAWMPLPEPYRAERRTDDLQ